MMTRSVNVSLSPGQPPASYGEDPGEEIFVGFILDDHHLALECLPEVECWVGLIYELEPAEQ